ncbi:MAG: hypothetical protein WA985_00645 [Erythrobacter sp.]|uniref:hypothetical protein n=1 Tax=Erythrobacter sp. TaxID=1042 RepID=UPI003C711B27
MTTQPIGYFVHHQGRGHAERATAIANELVDLRPVTLFCARDDIFRNLDPRVDLHTLPSLFEPTGDEAPMMASLPMPDTVHCAPLGWPGIRAAMADLAAWFEASNPALFVSDVSAELGQFARLCSVPHVAVLQHGERDDPGHTAAYTSAVGLLAPYSLDLEQSDRPQWMKGKTHYAPGVGVSVPDFPTQAEARERLDLPADREIVCVIGGGGGAGTPTAPLTIGARANPESLWITIGKVVSEWHETAPGNLVHRGWVDNPMDWVAAADRIVSSCGNTTVHMVLAAGKPWIAVPEWRYFDEQVCKAEVLDREGLAAVAKQWPSYAGGWEKLHYAARRLETADQARFVDPDAAKGAARWLDELGTALWEQSGAGEKGFAPPSLKVVA